jgi:hypothetical protein
VFSTRDEEWTPPSTIVELIDSNISDLLEDLIDSDFLWLDFDSDTLELIDCSEEAVSIMEAIADDSITLDEESTKFELATDSKCFELESDSFWDFEICDEELDFITCELEAASANWELEADCTTWDVDCEIAFFCARAKSAAVMLPLLPVPLTVNLRLCTFSVV